MLDKADFLKLRSLSHKGATELAAVEALCERVFAPLRQLEEQVGRAFKGQMTIRSKTQVAASDSLSFCICP